jgi:predicted exporter
MRSSFTRGNISLVSWVALVAAALLLAALMMSGQNWLRSNVFELLPESDYDPLTAAATTQVDMDLGTRLLFFVGHTDRSAAKSAADDLAADLLEHFLVDSVTARIDDSQYAAIAGFYYPYRRQILSDDQLHALVTDADGVEQRALANIFSPFGSGGATLATDPFFLFPDSLQTLRPPNAVLNLDDGYLWANRDGRDYVFVMASVVSPTLSIVEQEQLAQHMNAAIESAQSQDAGLDFLKTGFSFYAHEATQSAKGEISTIGVGSLIGLLLLVLTTFRSMRPLVLIVVSILAGCAIALAVTLSVFGFVHLFTLVFGASLIGVSVDYSFHYVADDAFGAEDWTPQKGLRNIFMGITLGLLTSILAYLALTVAPFPGLQQLAVFSSAGLIGAYLTLICVCGLWRRRISLNDRSLVLRFAQRFLGLWERSQPRHRYGLIGVLAVLIVIGYPTIDIDDDISVLQAQPPQLKRQEAVIQELLGVAQAGTFLLVSADTEEALLQLEESVRGELDALTGSGMLTGYQAISRWVPSRARQQRSHSAYVELIDTRAPGYFETLGVSEDAAAQTLGELTRKMSVLDISVWLESDVSEQFRNLWVTTESGEQASIVLLYGVQDVAALVDEISAYPDVTVVNKARELSGLFGQYRARVAQVLAAASVVILLGLGMRYGLRRAAILLVPPVFAGLAALIIISVLGQTLNLFNFLAMILVLGIGIDFTLFIAEARHEHVGTIFAITLSALTTMLAFGLLALSSTYAVHSFGLTVLIGIACAYLLSPLAVGVRTENE